MAGRRGAASRETPAAGAAPPRSPPTPPAAGLPGPGATPLRVHLCPVGFERDRILQPLLDLRADVVHLITRIPEERAEQHTEFLEKTLRGRNITVHRDGARYDFEPLLNLFGRLVQQHAQDHVYINISAGGTVAAVAGTMAAMMWDARAYYVIPAEYLDFAKPYTELEGCLALKDWKQARPRLQRLLDDHRAKSGGSDSTLYSRGVKAIIHLPQYRIPKPEEPLLVALGFIATQQELKRKTRKKDLIAHLEGRYPELFQYADRSRGEVTLQQKYGTLESRFLRPLQHEWGYITEEGSATASRLAATEAGLRAREIFRGIIEGL